MDWLKLLVRKGRTWFNMDWEARSLLLQALVLLPLVSLSLQMLGLRRTQTALRRFCQSKSASPEEQHIQALKTAQIVEIASHYSCPWATCLRKSLVLGYLLRRQGIVSDLRIGVRRVAGNLQAHAWIEYQGQVLNDRQDVQKRYAVYDRPIELIGL